MDNINAALAAHSPRHHQEYDEDRVYKEAFGGAPPVIAIFYIGATRDAEKSTEGCPVWHDTVMVYLKSTEPLNRDSFTDVATDEHKQKYPREWQAFVANQEKRKIPLDALPKMTPAVKAALNELNIRSVEDVIAFEKLPEYLSDYKKWATWIKSSHNAAEGKPKLKVVA